MGLIRSRPRISVRIPRAVLPGSSFNAEITLDSPRSIPIDFVDVTLDGTERVWVGAGKSTAKHERPLGAFAARMSGARTLDKGKTQFLCRFTLPPDVPPSFYGTWARVEYLLAVHVSIPWWPDRKSAFNVWVVAPPSTAPDTPGVRISSRPDGPEAQEPHVECSLASTTLEVGGVLVGSVALSNVRYNRYRSISVALSATEVTRSPNRSWQSVNKAVRFEVELPVADDVTEAQAHPFQMRLPKDIAHSRKSALFELIWTVSVRAKLSWASDVILDIPVVVLPPNSVTTRAGRAAPSVGFDRVQAVWSAVAQNLGLKLGDEGMRGRVGGCEVTIRRDHRGKEGVFLDAELRFPSVHLGLEGGPKGGFKALWSSGVKLGDEKWDRRNRVRGREEAQVRAFLDSLRPALINLDLDQVQDDRLQVRRRESGLNAPPLEAFVRAAMELAGRMDQARAAIPVPAAMSAARESWMQLAERLTSHLQPGDMRIEGELMQFRVEVSTEWTESAEPLRTVLVVRGTQPIREDYRIAWHSEDTSIVGQSALPKAAVAWLSQAIEGATALSIAEEGVEVSLPAPVMDAGPLLDRIQLLCDLLLSLRSATGPYR
ncbi:MAG: hypothetical protein HY898_26665 [Deltaproteobacteria bacterium]|nr:hypothetical protein [Deltaproteobacteria bacterium]